MSFRQLTASSLLLASLIPSRGWAQDPIPTERPPNVLLVVDTSGSMENMPDGSDPSCDPTGLLPSTKSRWIEVIEVLTGDITNYRCDAVDRKSSAFLTEYRLPTGIDPPDANYRNRYHRPMSGACTLGPDLVTLDGISSAFQYVAPVETCPFGQSPNGLIDSLSNNVRFGLMTFDTLPDPGTGFVGASPFGPSWSTGVAGAFSYYFGSEAMGMPFTCTTGAEPLEVGARNGAAPAWEGRMIHFGNPDGDTSYDNTRHSRVQQVLLSTRPYGATPIAGALTDAKTFLTLDSSHDPTPAGDAMQYTNASGTPPYGPALDPYVLEGCRKQYVILLSDGEPNLDLRPDCEGGAGDPNCPFAKAPDVAASLLVDPWAVETYVVGFVPETTSAGFDCTSLDESAYQAGGACENPADDEVRACCTLTQIAYEGGTKKAYFANDKTTLRSQLSAVFKEIVDVSGSATQPVRSPGKGASDTSAAVAYRVLTSYETGGDGLWRGNIERLRWECSTAGLPEEQDKDAGKGDDFSFNVNKNKDSRTFVSYIPDAVSGVVHADRSIRPNLASDPVDGIGLNKSSTGAVSGNPASFAGAVNDLALMSTCASLLGSPSASGCADLLLPWFVGLDNGTTNHRCPSAPSDPDDLTCSVIGDVMHSTPRVVNRPSASIDDQTYATFAELNATRPMMVYTSSNDGVLHGFHLSPNGGTVSAAVSDDSNNELFAFVPPAIFPLIESQYPSSRQKILDGVPVVSDVVAIVDPLNTYYGFKLERSSATLVNQGATWRTVMVQSFGGSNAGYFAVDITDPVAGPTFLWQLTKDENDAPLFGEQAATPLITTINLGGAEVAVAILPGGYGSPAGGACARTTPTVSTIQAGYEPRSQVRCYNLDQDNDGTIDGGVDSTTHIGARSLTIVRLDSGEVVRSFRKNVDEAPGLRDATSGEAGTNGLIALANLDSPITGTPAAYPSGTGAVADRIFVGDQDGALWRVNLSSPDPENWTMELFFDGYAKHPDFASPALAAAASHAVVLPPTLSVDLFGQVTVAFATGEQDLAGGATDENYVWSLRETVNDDASGFLTTVNWYQELTGGEHVLGSMPLLGSVLYYSTYSPDTTLTYCSSGGSTIYGVHYLNPSDDNDPSLGGAAGLARAGSGTLVASQTAAELNLDPDTLIFGVTLEYEPTCFDDSVPDATWSGGTDNKPANVSQSQLKLTFQTSIPSSNTEKLGFETGFESIALEPPRATASIESWAPVLD